MDVAVAAVVLLFEIFQEIFCQWEIEFVALASITKVYSSCVPRSSLPGFFAEIFRGGFFQSLWWLKFTRASARN